MLEYNEICLTHSAFLHYPEYCIIEYALYRNGNVNAHLCCAVYSELQFRIYIYICPAILGLWLTEIK